MFITKGPVKKLCAGEGGKMEDSALAGVPNVEQQTNHVQVEGIEG